MKKILLPVDGSVSALRAVDHAIQSAHAWGEGTEIHLLNVQPAIVSGDVKMFIRREDIEGYQQEEGLKALASSREKLDAAGVPYVYHIGVGTMAETIAEYTRQLGCDQIIMGSRGLGSVASLVLGSVATKVIHLVDVPVCLVK